MLKVHAYQYSESIDVKSFKSNFTADLKYSSPDELFYKADGDRFVYVFKYGGICFLNYDAIKIAEFFKLMTQYTKNQFENKLYEEFLQMFATDYKVVNHKNFQDKKIGSALLNFIETDLQKRNARQLYIETSDKLQYAPTRMFYERRGYKLVAHFRDYYDVDDGKVIYQKLFTK